MKVHSALVAFALLFPAIALTACKGSTEPSRPALSDAATAKWFAYHIVNAMGTAAPSGSSSQTWTNQVVGGSVSGTATVNGSFTYSYNGVGPASRSYNNVTIQFNNFCVPFSSLSNSCVSGTVTVNGTCTTTYGNTVTYSGAWQVSGTGISVTSTEVEGQASIVMQLYNDPSRIFAAYVTAGGSTWPVSEP